MKYLVCLIVLGLVSIVPTSYSQSKNLNDLCLYLEIRAEAPNLYRVPTSTNQVKSIVDRIAQIILNREADSLTGMHVEPAFEMLGISFYSFSKIKGLDFTQEQLIGIGRLGSIFFVDSAVGVVNQYLGSVGPGDSTVFENAVQLFERLEFYGTNVDFVDRPEALDLPDRITHWIETGFSRTDGGMMQGRFIKLPSNYPVRGTETWLLRYSMKDSKFVVRRLLYSRCPSE